MANHSSATTREHTSHLIELQQQSDALKQRTPSLIQDKSINPQSRALTDYALDINGSELLRRVEAAETISDDLSCGPAEQRTETHSTEAKIEALAEVICSAGEEPSAALLVLMAMLENSMHPNALAHTTKHIAFTRCGEWNSFGMVEAQIAMLEDKLLARPGASA